MSLPIILMAGSLGTFPGIVIDGNTEFAPIDADYTAANQFYRPSDTFNGVTEYQNCRNCAVYWNGAGYWIIATAPHGTGTPLYQVAGPATAIPSYGWSPVIGSGTTTPPTFALITEGMSSGGYVLTNQNGTTQDTAYDPQLVGQFLPVSGQSSLSEPNGATQYAGFSIDGYLRAVAYVPASGGPIWMILNGLAGIGTPDPQDEAFVPINVFPTGGWTINYSPLGALPVPTFASNIGSTLTASSDSINCSNYNTGVELDWNIVGTAGEQSSIVPIIDNGAAAQNPLGYYPASSGKSGTPINDSSSLDPPVSVVTEVSSGLVNVFTFVGSLQVYPTQTTTYTITTTIGGAADQQWVTIIYPSVLVCLGITPSAGVTTTLLTCANISTGAALSWFCTGTISQSIDQGIGAVGPVGSLQVYPLTTETWTLTAQPGNITASATVTVDPTLLFPSLDGMINWFEGGENFTAGTYLITCCGGSFQYNNNAGFGINWSDEKTSVDQAFKITTVPGTFNPLPGHAFTPASGEGRYIFDAPGHFVPYSSSAAASTVNAGIAVYYQHNGGPIGIYLNLDSTAGCLPGSMPPTFSLQGPGPDPTITATPSSINAGQTSEVAWGVLNSPTTVTIDNGIGTVTASGSAALTPTLPGDNRVNLTAIGAGGITQSVWTDIWVCGPKPPSSLSFTGAAAGNVIVSWSTTPVTACTQNVLIERSIDGNVFAQIASVALSAGTYTDTTPIPGTTYYYRARSSDAAGNCSPYTVDYSAASILIPSSPVVTLLGGAVPGNGNVASAMISPTGLPFLTWPAVPGATSYNIYKGYSAGNMTIYSTGVTNLFYVDAAANFGVTVYYSVTAVNAGGESAQSAAQSITPARFLSGTGAIYN